MYACPVGSQNSNGTGGDGGMGGGWIFIIILISVAAAYVIGGIVFLKFVRKHEGAEIVPNREFWLAIPGLVRDGCVWTFGTIKAKVTGQSYSKI